jgi:formylglycine-generating enzyme required for sulfatase activity
MKTPVPLMFLVLVIVAIAGIRVIAPTPRPVARWQDPAAGIQFTLVLPGTFKMGTPSSEPGRDPEEVPHDVTVSRAFYLGITEVTQAQWMSVMGTNPSHFSSCGARCPVENVSWYDVQTFIERLNASGGRAFRLPTEAEWEYACRAGGMQPFGGTDVLTSQFANINGDFPYNGPKGVFRQRPMPVGQFAPNAWGFFDMSGNVWEWTADEHCPYPSAPVSDPRAACGSPLKVIRGGSWAFDANSARCGTRYTHRAQDKGYSLGVRLAHDAS